jgi:hypothetical protein
MSILRPALLVLPLSSCILVVDGDGHLHHRMVRGSGVRVDEDRKVGEFRAIELEVPATVEVRVGEGPSLHLSGDDNVLPGIQTRVSDGVLKIEISRSAWYQSELKLVIQTPTLERFTVEGSGDVRIQNLAERPVELAIEGSGNIHAHGRVPALKGSIEGSGSLELGQLEATEANLSIEGSGSMEVQVAKFLRYSIEGSGEITYAGDPKLEGDIDGSGEVERRR